MKALPFLLLALAFALEPASKETSEQDVEVNLPYSEDGCSGSLDTKRMSLQEFKALSTYAGLNNGSFSYAFWVNEPKEIKEARIQGEQDLVHIKNTISNSPSLSGELLKLMKNTAHQLNYNLTKNKKLLNFMETWDPKILHKPTVKSETPLNHVRLSQDEKLKKEKILNTPIEKRRYKDLTCNQIVEILSDEAKLVPFSLSLGKHRCRYKRNAKGCDKDFYYDPNMNLKDQVKKRIDIFKWSYFANNVCLVHLPISDPKVDLERVSNKIRNHLASYVLNIECTSGW